MKFGFRLAILSALLAGCGGAASMTPSGTAGSTGAGGAFATGAAGTVGSPTGSAGAASCATKGGGFEQIEINGSIVEFEIPEVGFEGKSLQTGPDGSLYYSDLDDVMKLTSKDSNPLATTLKVKWSAVASVGNMGGFTFGPDGNVWVTDGRANQVDRFLPDLTVERFQGPDLNPTGVSDGEYGAIIAGPDDNLWFIAGKRSFGKLGRLTLAGTFLPAFEIPGLDTELIKGANGTVWIDLPAGASAVSVDGSIKTIGGSLGGSTILGPDGNLWKGQGASLEVIKADGTRTTITIPHLNNQAPEPISGSIGAITAGADGNIWFTIKGIERGVGRISPTGADFKAYMLPKGCKTTSDPLSIGNGPGGTIWFSEPYAQKLGRVTP